MQLQAERLYAAAQLTGLGVLGALVLPGILLWLTKGQVSPLKAVGTFSKALALAFGTSSSSAALPVRLSKLTVLSVPLLAALHNTLLKAVSTFSRALVLAFGTSSSSAALPVRLSDLRLLPLTCGQSCFAKVAERSQHFQHSPRRWPSAAACCLQHQNNKLGISCCLACISSRHLQ